jgi:uncharacterized membrane protein HdeD (DUF308 family)
MLNLMVSKWWLFAVRGVLAILFGVLAFVRPDVTLVALVGLFGIYALADGFLGFAGAFALTGSRYFWWLLLEGIAGVTAGVFTFEMPGVTALSLLLLLGIWLVFSGIFRIVSAIELRKQMDNEWLYILSGVFSVIAGALTFCGPLQSAISWVWVIGVYAVLFGLMSLSLGVKLRKLDVDGQTSHTIAQRGI